MKTCPTCHAKVFEDMSTCYSCLHRFEDKPDLDEDFLEVEDPLPITAVATASPDAASERGANAASATPVKPDSPAARMKPAHPGLPSPSAPKHAKSQPGDWIVRFEMRNANDPCQTWSIELNPANWPAALTPA